MTKRVKSIPVWLRNGMFRIRYDNGQVDNKASIGGKLNKLWSNPRNGKVLGVTYFYMDMWKWVNTVFYEFRVAKWAFRAVWKNKYGW